MGKQSNILSFDEVKREVGAKRPSAVAPNAAARRRPPVDASGAFAPSGRARHAASSTRASVGDIRRASSSARSSARPALTTFSDRKDRSSLEGSSARRGCTISSKQNLAVDETEIEREEEVPEKRSRLAEFRRKRQKQHAEKKFNKQFGGSRPAGDASSGSRAAVYKGEMGSTHRRSSRMQNETSPTSRGSVGLGLLGRIASLKSSPKFAAGAAMVVCMILTCWFLYTPAQQFYHSVREHDRLQAEYAAIEQRNTSLQSEVDALATSSGIEDRAHSQFGWVKEGEQTATVKGLSEQPEEGSSFTANVVPGSIAAPETWYSPVLDAFFGVA